ncbi:MAG TPA: PAS domain-containing protein [Azospirillaceae bacterium]|nr:PAS domain-containing protein [Azospirillaceae bacterium]
MTDTKNQNRKGTGGLGTAEARLERLRDEGGAFVAAVEATRMPMVVTDPAVADNPIVYANAAFLKLCGYTREEVLGQNYHFLGGPNTDPEVVRKIDAALGARQDIDIEVQFYTKDGRPIWVMQYVSPVIDDRGRITQHFASFFDITDRKEVETRLRHLTDDLERRVRARTRKLEAVNQRLEEEIERRRNLEDVLRAALDEKQNLLREKDFLIKEVNHRIKNSLMAVESLLSIQADMLADEDARDALASAIRRLRRFGEIHELLYRSSNHQSIDVRDYLETLCRGLLMSFGIDPEVVELDLHAEEVTWGPDRALPLALIVNEAVTNALKYAFPQGRRGTIDVDLSCKAHGMHQLTIRDNGIGIPAKRRGNSLGLELIEMMARQLGGKADIQAEGGTVVTVTFPA